MRDVLLSRCEAFIQYRDLLRKQFKFENSYLYPICANVFCARGVFPTEESLAMCKGILKSRANAFSNFRGNLSLPIISMLASGPAPEARMDEAMENYAALKKHFFGSQYLALSAFVLADMGVGDRAIAHVERGREIYDRMKKEHPFLTSAEDCVFAVLLSFSPKSFDQLVDETEWIYQTVKKRFSNGNAAQAISHVLTLAPDDPAEKAQRLFALYDGIRDAGGKYGKTYQLSALAAASLSETDVDELVRDIVDVDQFLSAQKGYGFLSTDRRTRMMHAAMLVSDQETLHRDCICSLLEDDAAARNAGQTAVLTSTLAMLAAQQAAMCAVVSTSAAVSASAN